MLNDIVFTKMLQFYKLTHSIHTVRTVTHNGVLRVGAGTSVLARVGRGVIAGGVL
jgi:hypothetical protein